MTVIDFVEARKTRRRRVLDTGLIRFGDMSICCVVRNLSEAGAALDIGSHVGIPDQFTLIVVPQKKIYSCGVVWRKDRRIGVRFASPTENPPA
jgi:PilZ domain